MRTIRLVFALLFLTLTMLGCQRQEESSAKVTVPPTAVVSQTEASVPSSPLTPFDAKNIEIQVNFFENKFGLTPKALKNLSREYEIGKCFIKVELDKKDNIISMAADLDDNCFVLVPFAGESSRNVSINSLISDYKKNRYVPKFLVTCISSCGHTRDGAYEILESGVSANGNVDLVYMFSENAGISKWLDLVKTKLKLDFLGDSDEIINCTDDFNKLALENWGDGKPQAIKIFSSRGYTSSVESGCKRSVAASSNSAAQPLSSASPKTSGPKLEAALGATSKDQNIVRENKRE